jgi:hypothetical protein
MREIVFDETSRAAGEVDDKDWQHGVFTDFDCLSTVGFQGHFRSSDVVDHLPTTINQVWFEGQSGNLKPQELRAVVDRLLLDFVNNASVKLPVLKQITFLQGLAIYYDGEEATSKSLVRRFLEFCEQKGIKVASGSEIIRRSDPV